MKRSTYLSTCYPVNYSKLQENAVTGGNGSGIGNGIIDYHQWYNGTTSVLIKGNDGFSRSAGWNYPYEESCFVSRGGGAMNPRGSYGDAAGFQGVSGARGGEYWFSCCYKS